MRLISQRIAMAFLAGNAKALSNTSTDGYYVYLFGNIIAHKTDTDVIKVSLAGYNTATTRERVNGILRTAGSSKSLSTKKGQPLLFDATTKLSTPIGSKDWITV